jgi:hypothetical protein
MSRKRPRKYFISGFLCELLLVGFLALVVGRDVSEAAGQCNTHYDCSQACLNHGSPFQSSDYQEETSTQYSTGSSNPRCGTFFQYNGPNCDGTPLAYNSYCSGCCAPN